MIGGTKCDTGVSSWSQEAITKHRLEAFVVGGISDWRWLTKDIKSSKMYPKEPT